MNNNATVEIIYTILKNCKEYRSENNCSTCPKQNSAECKKKSCKWHYIPQGNGGLTLWGVDYLLGQILRQINVPDERKHVSDGAMKKWQELGLNKNDIWKYSYQDWVNCNSSKTVKECKGASSKFEDVNVAEAGGFKFRNVFHDEHIVPIHDILLELFKIPTEELNQEIIIYYLNKIHICRMLKEEDREIHPRYNRGYDLNYKEIYLHIYKPNGVVISNLDQDMIRY